MQAKEETGAENNGKGHVGKESHPKLGGNWKRKKSTESNCDNKSKRQRREQIGNSLDCKNDANVKEPHKMVVDGCQYCCVFCNESFEKEASLMKHIHMHTRERPYSCDQCELDFVNKKALQIHLKTHKIYHCPSCRFSSQSSYVLNLHVKAIHKQTGSGDAGMTEKELNENDTSHPESEAESYKPTVEKSSTSSLQELGVKQELVIENRNSDTEPEEIDEVSPVSSRKSIQREKYATPTAKSNQKQDHPFTNGPFVCVICEKVFPRNNSLIRHIHTHTGEKSFSCKTCGKEFAFVYNLNCHLKTHSAWLKFKCKKCVAGFRRQTHLDRHVKDIHERTENNVVPSTSLLMNKKAKENGQSDSDSELEWGKYPTIYHCEKCGHQFKLESPYIAHINKEHNKKPNRYKCQKCAKSFPKKNGLERHMKAMHSKKRPFSCSECNKSFIWEWRLNQHKKAHSEERPFSCEYAYCNKAYKNKSDLKEHWRTHTGERPFKCSECGKSFTAHGLFSNHLKRHSGVLSFSCDICGDKFINKRNLNCHKKAKHNAK